MPGPPNQIAPPVYEPPLPGPGPLERAKRFAKDVVKRWLPTFLAKEIQVYRRFSKAERAIYLKLRRMYSLGLGNKKEIKSLVGARSFVFVCFGNLMRSPMCEALMRRELAGQNPQFKLISAGLHASPGTPAHPWALAAARELGVLLDDHRSQQLTAEMVHQADAIFAMDHQNQVELLAQCPEAKEKIFMLRAYEGTAGRRMEIQDPYYGDLEQTRQCYRLLQNCVHNVASEVLQGPASSQGVLLRDAEPRKRSCRGNRWAS